MKEFLSKYQKTPVIQYPNNVAVNPVVTVCVQTYQHVNYIKDCLEGILMQKTNFPFEILLGEDESKDGTRETCIEYAEKHPDKIKLFLHSRENNIKIGGVPTGRFNFLYNLHSAQGKYIALCEGDDYWTDPLKLQKQVDFLEANPDYSLCFHNSRIVDSKNKVIKESYLNDFQKKDLTQDEIIGGSLIPTQTVMFISDPIKDIPDIFHNVFNGDVFLFAFLGLHGKAKYLGQISPASYRVHGNGIWSGLQKQEQAEMTLKTFEEIYRFVPKRFKQTARFTVGKIHANLTGKYFRARKYKLAFSHYLGLLKNAFFTFQWYYILRKTYSIFLKK